MTNYFSIFKAIISFFVLLWTVSANANEPARERISINQNWKFALGHATDKAKDFNHGTGYFSYLAKTGFGDGPANAAFDDRAWRTVNLPHDWAVEMPFDGNASPSHGSKAENTITAKNITTTQRIIFLPSCN